MTQPGAGQDINLAALWIPVMPETSHMGEEMRKAGGEAKRQFEQGFNSGASPESIGSSFGSKLQSSISKEMSNFELPFGMDSMFQKFGQSVDVNVIQKLKGEASDALSNYRNEYDRLTEATGHATEASNNQAQAEANLKLARDNGINQAQVVLPLMEKQTTATRENVSAQKELESAHASTGAALEDYNGKASKLNDVTKEASSSSSMMAGVMGGAVFAAVQGVTGAVESFYEHLIEGVVEGFKMGADAAKEFADTMIEVGETYEHIGIQVQEFSGASGEALEQFESHAQGVFNSLDVAGKNTGQTMAQFASMLNAEPGPALDTLTKHVEELQGRFTSLKGANLASIFVDFKTPVEQADSALASLLQSARNSGQDFGVFTQQLSGNVAVTLQEAGLNLQQSGAFMGELMKLGEPGRQTMAGLASAMKEFGKEGLTFGDGMKLAGEKLKELGDTAAGQDMAEKLFGTRNWIVAKNAVQDYLNIVAQGPNAFNASGSSLDDFIEKTKTLENSWEQVKHRAMEAFEPMGLEAVKLVGSGLDSLVGFVQSHMDQIKRDVELGGLWIIKYARDFQTFGQGMLDFFAPITDAVVGFVYGAIESIAGFSKAVGEVISWIPGMHDMGDGLIAASNGASKFADGLHNLQVGDKMRELSEWSKQHPIDVGKAGQSWIDFANTVGTSMDSAKKSVEGFSGMAGAATGFGGILSAPSLSAGTPIGGAPAVAAPPSGFTPPSGAGAPSSTTTTTTTTTAPVRGPGGSGTSPNGFTLGAPESGFSVNGVSAQDATGDAGQRLQQFAQWFNNNIEPVKELAGYDAGGHGLGSKSNHTSGSALDINWSDFTALQGHGADARTHFSAAQMQEIAQELSAMGMTWGQYWTPGSRDPGHFELGGASYDSGPKNIDPTTGQPAGGTAAPMGTSIYQPVTPSGTVPGGKNGAAFPGMPGQYGGNGVYGGETSDQAFSANQAVQEAQDRKADLDYDVGQKQQRVQDLQTQLSQVGTGPGKVGLLGQPLPADPKQAAADDKKRHDLNEQLANATHELTVSQREQAEQGGKITEAQRKQQEAMYNKPKGATTGKTGEGQAGETLGSGLLAGIGQELGLGDVLGKSPMDWGIVKLFEGLFSYANGLGNAIFGATGGAQGGGLTASGGGGMLSGMASGLGISLPKANVSAGPNVQPAVPGTPASGQGSGPAPGPVTIDNSIHVSSDVSDTKVLAPVQEQQNANNASAFTYSGGVPAQ